MIHLEVFYNYISNTWSLRRNAACRLRHSDFPVTNQQDEDTKDHVIRVAKSATAEEIF